MDFKSLDQIKVAVAAGLQVYWRSNSYQVIQDSKGRTFIKHLGGHCLPLLDHKPGDFFVMCGGNIRGPQLETGGY